MKTANDLVAQAKSRIQEVSVQDADSAINAADVLIDVRDDLEYAAGHIPGAVHMSRGMLEFKMSLNPALQSRDLKLVLYCRTSGRAALAAASLQEMGYLNIKSIAGGFEAWNAAGKPVAKPDLPNFG
ncbi:MAG TPA: rhodanese-like domain-containing protein [Burkholderiaceae bacterium]|nr:rhodanese-like domain-containing protein [Burkholderiaceae bacterium]